MDNIRFEFNAKKYMKSLIFVCVWTGVISFYHLTINIIEIITDSIINLGHWPLHTTIVFSMIFLISVCFTIYGFRYKVKIINNTLYIRLVFKFKEYDLDTLKKYNVSLYGKNTKFVIYFSNKKRRTVVTVEKDQLATILNEYVKDNLSVES